MRAFALEIPKSTELILRRIGKVEAVVEVSGQHESLALLNRGDYILCQQ